MVEEKKKRRPKGDGSVQQLAKDKFKMQITIGYDANGKQIKKSFTGKTQREVVDKKNQYLAEQKKGTLVRSSNCKIAEYIERWLSIKEGQTKRTTYESYVETCNFHIKPVLGMHKLQKLTTAHLNDYLSAKLKSGLSPASVTRQRAIIHGILDLAVKEGLVPRNVADYCNSITIQREEVKTLSQDEMDRLLSTARGVYEQDKDNDNRFSQLYHIILILLATGARRGEVLALKWSNIDFEKRTIAIKENLVEVKGGLRLETPKTKNSRRVISIDPNILQQLQELRGESEWVFHTRTGKPLTPSNVGRSYRKLLKEVGIEGVRLHDMRHTHATQLVASRLSIKMISERLGHTDTRITLNLYTHALPEQDREAAEVMGAMLIKKKD